MKYEKSCGSVVIDNNKVLLVQQKSGFYGFPKGHVEMNESEEETAVREVKEETNLDIEVNSSLRFPITYLQKGDFTKEVIYFVGKKISDNNIKFQEKELLKAFWVDIDLVESTLTFEDAKTMWKSVLESISKK